MSFYTEEKEREHRFVLALRMGLPLFLLFGVALYVLLIGRDATPASFIFLSLILLVGAIYLSSFLSIKVPTKQSPIRLPIRLVTTIFPNFFIAGANTLL